MALQQLLLRRGGGGGRVQVQLQQVQHHYQYHHPRRQQELQLTHACGRFYLTHQNRRRCHNHVHHIHIGHHTSSHPPLSTPPQNKRPGSANTAAILRPTLRRAFAPLPLASRHLQHRLYSELKMTTETNWPAAKVRQTFLDYFEKRGHTVGEYSLVRPIPWSPAAHDILGRLIFHHDNTAIEPAHSMPTQTC